MTTYEIFEYLVLALVFVACCAAAVRKLVPSLWARLTGQKPSAVAKACGGGCCSTGGGCEDPTTRHVQLHLPGRH